MFMYGLLMLPEIYTNPSKRLKPRNLSWQAFGLEHCGAVLEKSKEYAYQQTHADIWRYTAAKWFAKQGEN